ncbi:transferrin-binding protein-like solute binding protein [Lacibacterium aquatile]|uniref:Transferrin-binding protein-like solute binding protein n=1 Tax=Lacibacterium aquatile TaxID=1168082 RepID=A0ABW5DT16_9PROT
MRLVPVSLLTVLLAGTALAQTAAPRVPLPAGESQAGTTMAVTTANGTPRIAPPRQLQVGVDVFQNEKVDTPADGQIQLVFLDGTAFTMGPNGSMVLDELVYDPVAEKGTLAMSVTKGAFRFVGGKLSKDEPVTIKTPIGTIGIRGGIGSFTIGGDGSVDAAFMFGRSLTLTNQNGQSLELTRPGFAARMLPGGNFEPPRRLSANEIRAQKAQFEGGGNGAVTDVGLEGGLSSSQGQILAEVPVVTTPANVNTREISQQRSNTGSNGLVVYNFATDASLGTKLAFVPTIDGESFDFASSSPVYFYQPSTKIGDKDAEGRYINTGGLQVNFGISGTGASQKSIISLAALYVGEYNGGGIVEVNGALRGGAMLGGNDGYPYILSGGLTNTLPNDPTLADGSGFPDKLTLDNKQITGSGGERYDHDAYVFGTYYDYETNSRYEKGYKFKHELTRNTESTGSATRTSRTINGFATGLGSLMPYGNIPMVSDSVAITTNAELGRVTGEFGFEAPTYDGNGSQKVHLSFGPTTEGSSISGGPGFIDDKRFAAANGITYSSSSSSGYTQRSYYEVEGEKVQMDYAATYMISGGLTDISNITPSSVQTCACEYVQWGWWGGQFVVPGSGGYISTEAVHLGTWVAGDMLSAADVPRSGSASYVGQAIGTVQTINSAGRNQYVAVGGAQVDYNFGTRKGTFALKDFDGVNLSTSVTGSSSTGTYTGQKNQTVAGVSSGLAVKGGFFGPKAAETAGHFSFAQSGGSSASVASQKFGTGVFLGKMK